MKNIISNTQVIFAALAMITWWPVCGGFAQSAGGNPAQNFPYVIQLESGAAEFAPGDQITIASVRSDRLHIEVGGTYIVEGHYTLVSVDKADLSLFCTSRGPSGPTPIQTAQRTNVTKGSGSFELRETLGGDGWLHVTFYVHGHAHGGVYFGEAGAENTVLRKKGWSDFSPQTSSTANATGAVGDANRALMEYLGDPVPAPADMDQRYNRENLTKAFRAMSRRAGWTVTKLAVDDSEFPYLVYGTLAGKHTLETSQFDEAGGYPYGGSVRGSTGDGSTYFAVNMVPPSQFPNVAAQICHRRMIVRLEMLADKAGSSE